MFMYRHLSSLLLLRLIAAPDILSSLSQIKNCHLTLDETCRGKFMQDDKLRLEDLLGSTKTANNIDDRINNVAIIGAGVMGQGIGQTIASQGMEVIIVEIDDKHLENAKSQLSESIDREIKRWAMTNSEKKSIMSRITWVTDFEAVKECELIIEAVQEDFDAKVKVFEQLDKIVHNNAIFISNGRLRSATA